MNALLIGEPCGEDSLHKTSDGTLVRPGSSLKLLA
jgi:hypothetical protein